MIITKKNRNKNRNNKTKSKDKGNDIRKTSVKHITKKYAHSRILKHKQIDKQINKQINKQIDKQTGNGIFNSVGKFVFNPDAGKKYTTPLTSVSSILNPSKLEKRFSRHNNQLFQITYNYNTPNPLNIYVNKQKPIPSTLVENEPHIIINNMQRFLITLVDDTPYNKLLWVAEFANNSKKKTILTYKSPTPIGLEKHKYAIKIYTYPNNAIPFTPIDFASIKRTPEYKNFITYLNNPQNKDKIKLIRVYPLNIYKDTSSGVSIFNVLSKKTTKPSLTSMIPASQLYKNIKANADVKLMATAH